MLISTGNSTWEYDNMNFTVIVQANLLIRYIPLTHVSFPQNFVGLSVSDGYIATGSETNEVMCLSIHSS